MFIIIMFNFLGCFVAINEAPEQYLGNKEISKVDIQLLITKYFK